MKTQMTFTQGSVNMVGTPYIVRQQELALIMSENPEELTLKIKSTGEKAVLPMHKSLSGKTISYIGEITAEMAKTLGAFTSYVYEQRYDLVVNCDGHFYISAYARKNENCKWECRQMTDVATDRVEII